MIYKGRVIKENITTIQRYKKVEICGDKKAVSEIYINSDKFSKFVDELCLTRDELLKNENSKIVVDIYEGYKNDDYPEVNSSPMLIFYLEKTIPESKENRLKRINDEKNKIDREEEQVLKYNKELEQDRVKREIEHLEKLGYTIKKIKKEENE